ncbi:MAG TPA: Crp/Fnr family transcriptional regulator [Chitinophagaceae bacterium]|nr:Crp/Fnr family transcriptional regulator [Chitinophagaceae bacterium]
MYSLILQNIERHVQLTDDEQVYFTSLLQLKKVKRRQLLIPAGEPCRFEYFVIKGCLKQYYLDNNGQEHILMFAPEDWWVGDMYSFVYNKPALTTVEAIEDTEVLALDRKRFDDLVLTVPKFERFFRILLQRAFVANQRRIIESMSLSGAERYENFIAQYPSLEQRLPQRLVAYYLGITPESLSRIKAASAKKRR